MNRQSGFNIFELMIAVAVLGVLLGVGVPGMQAYIYNGRLVTQINSLSTVFAHARSAAIKLNQRVVVCVSSDGKQCDNVGSGTLWNKGWLVFVDRNKNSTVDAGGGGVDDCAVGSTTDCVMSVEPEFVGANTLTPASGVKDFVIYTGDGSAKCLDPGKVGNLIACVNSTNYFTLCDFRGAAFAKALAISNTGRVSTIDKRPDGTALACP